MEDNSEYPSDSILLTVSENLNTEWENLAQTLEVDITIFTYNFISNYKAYDMIKLWWKRTKSNKYKKLKRALYKSDMFELISFMDQYFIEYGCRECFSRINFINNNFLGLISFKIGIKWYRLGLILGIDSCRLQRISSKYSHYKMAKSFQILKIWKYQKTSPPNTLFKFALDTGKYDVLALLNKHR